MEVYIIATIGICLGYFLQSIIGFGASLIAIPLLITVVSLQQAVVLVTLFAITLSLSAVLSCYKQADIRLVLQIALFALPGAVLGIALLKVGDPIWLKKILGIFIVLYVVYKVTVTTVVKTPRIVVYILSFLGGVFSGLLAAGGPTYVIAINSCIRDIRKFRASMLVLIGIVGSSRVPILWYNGILKSSYFTLYLKILPFFLLAIFIGNVLHHKINDKWLVNAVLVVLCVSGVFLIYR